MPLNFLKRGKSSSAEHNAAQIYAGLVETARRPDWYVKGGVPDTVDGRFDMIAMMVSLHLIGLERFEEEDRARQMTSLIYEQFVSDMDASFRQMGINDMVISKHVGRSMEALGGRVGAYRKAAAGDQEGVEAALLRNLYRGETPGKEALGWATEAFAARAKHAATANLDALLESAR